MKVSSNRLSCRVLVCSAILLAGAAACKAAEKDGKTVSDEWCGYSVTVAEPWQRSSLREYKVPGAIRCAWSGPNGASIVIFVQEPGAAVSPRAMLDSSVKVQKDKLGAAAEVQSVRPVAGMQAMWMVVTGKGTGGAIDGNGSVNTTQHWVAVPRERDVVIVLLSCPASDYAKFKDSFEAAAGSMKINGSQTAEQKAAK